MDRDQRGIGLTAYLLLAIAAMGMLYGLYALVDANWSTSAGRKEGRTEVQAQWDAAVEDQRDRDRMASLNAAKGLQEARSKVRVKVEERTVYVDKNIEKLVFVDACFTSLGVSCLNGAIDGTGGVGCKPDGAMPGIKPSSGRGLQDGLTVGLGYGGQIQRLPGEAQSPR